MRISRIFETTIRTIAAIANTTSTEGRTDPCHHLTRPGIVVVA